MKKFSPSLEGSFHVDLEKYPQANEEKLLESLQLFIKSQYPSRHSINQNKISFSNSLFRWKVNRGRNYIRAFNKGMLTIFKDEKTLYVDYQGGLYRGVFIAALTAMFTLAAFMVMAPTGWWMAVLIFMLAYFQQVYTTHIVFPMWLAKHIHLFLSELEG